MLYGSVLFKIILQHLQGKTNLINFSHPHSYSLLPYRLKFHSSLVYAFDANES